MLVMVAALYGFSCGKTRTLFVALIVQNDFPMICLRNKHLQLGP